MTIEIKTSSVVAVSAIEHNQFGCPYCGYRSGRTLASSGGSAVWRCGSEDCGKTSCILSGGVTRSFIDFDDFFRPELQAHPRRGIPSHGRSDKRPDGGGEFFRPRGLGGDITPGCFVCGGEERRYHNIAAFVQCREAGERVVAMFSQGARLDYRDFEPDRVQVKIGACNRHIANLEKLYGLTQSSRVITDKCISAAMV